MVRLNIRIEVDNILLRCISCSLIGPTLDFTFIFVLLVETTVEVIELTPQIRDHYQKLIVARIITKRLSV
jgi:hypothetical protein